MAKRQRRTSPVGGLRKRPAARVRPRARNTAPPSGPVVSVADKLPVRSAPLPMIPLSVADDAIDAASMTEAFAIPYLSSRRRSKAASVTSRPQLPSTSSSLGNPVMALRTATGFDRPVVSLGSAGFVLSGATPDVSGRVASMRVLALLLGMALVVLAGLVLALGLLAGSLHLQSREDVERLQQPPVVEALPRTRVDTGSEPVVPPLPSLGTTGSDVVVVPRNPTDDSPPVPEEPPAALADVEVVLEPGLPFTAVEIGCPGHGFRTREPFSGGVATIAEVPTGTSCTAKLKGGPPVSHPVRAGQVLRCATGSGGRIDCR